jgi:hypothetical protein
MAKRFLKLTYWRWLVRCYLFYRWSRELIKLLITTLKITSQIY